MGSFVYEGLLLFGIALVPGAVGALFEVLIGRTHWLQSEFALRCLAFMIYAIYFVWFWTARGQTLPMKTWHIRLVDKQGKNLTQRRALLRFLASCTWFAPAALMVGLNQWTRWESLGVVALGVVLYALLSLCMPDRQFWHDVLCQTRLVYDPPPRAYVQPA